MGNLLCLFVTRLHPLEPDSYLTTFHPTQPFTLTLYYSVVAVYGKYSVYSPFRFHEFTQTDNFSNPDSSIIDVFLVNTLSKRSNAPNHVHSTKKKRNASTVNNPKKNEAHNNFPALASTPHCLRPFVIRPSPSIQSHISKSHRPFIISYSFHVEK